MNIIKSNFKWANVLGTREETKYIVLHHRAGDGDVESIHKQHLEKGWAGIGYHYYIRKDGTIYAGRPEYTIGAHVTNYNNCSIGICFEGNYTVTETMPSAQFKAGNQLITKLKKTYPLAAIVPHNSLRPTACPGLYFPFKLITREALELTKAEAIKVIKEKTGLSDMSLQYLQSYKYDKDLIIKLAQPMIN